MVIEFTRYLLARVGAEVEKVKYSVLKRFAVVEVPRETGYSFYQSPPQFDKEIEAVLKTDMGKCVRIEKGYVVFNRAPGCLERFNLIIEYERKYEVLHVRDAIMAVDVEITWFIRLVGGGW